MVTSFQYVQWSHWSTFILGKCDRSQACPSLIVVIVFISPLFIPGGAWNIILDECIFIKMKITIFFRPVRPLTFEYMKYMWVITVFESIFLLRKLGFPPQNWKPKLYFGAFDQREFFLTSTFYVTCTFSEI